MSDLKEYKRLFKKHYNYAMKLKEDGEAWDREITLARKYLELGTAEYHKQLKEKYN